MNPHFCQDITIGCPNGNLEGRITYLEENMANPGVILCSPHPLLAGNMENNVITTLVQTLARSFPVLSFNYRAVGKSFKPDPDLPLFEYWNRIDQNNDFSAIIEDTRQVIDWSCSRLFTHCHLVGYSFGSFIGLQALPESALSFTGITPPLAEHDFLQLRSISCKTFLLFAQKDSLLREQKGSFPPTVTIHEILDSDHFFLHREQEVADIVTSFLMSV